MPLSIRTKILSAAHKMGRTLLLGSTLGAVAAVSAPAAFAGPLITNGSFESSTATYNTGSATVGSVLNSTDLSGWSTTGCLNNCTSGNNLFMFLMAPNYGTNGVWWYPSNSNPNAGGIISFYSVPGVSPDGGNGIGVDAGNLTGALQQTVNGLVTGQTYALTFYQATTQAKDASVQTGFTANWQVSLGGQTKISDTMSNPLNGFSPWVKETLLFTATSSQELLSFLATSPGTGQPPFLLLDGVSLDQVPEPASLALLIAGVTGLIIVRRKRRAA